MAMPMLALTTQRHRRAGELEGLAEDVEEAFGDEFGTDVQDGPVDEHDELVAAHPADGVGVSQGGFQSGGDRDEELVAGFVAEGSR